MKIMRLTLTNFKGVKDFTLDTQGEDVNIYGDNAVGKTTIFDAFTWLLFGKDSLNRADFEIKTLGPDGEPLHGLEHSVEGVFDIAGKELTLKKVYAEKWTKKRGNATKQFTGHTVDHFINGVPAKKGEYEAHIAEIIGEDTFKLLTNPKYFNEHLHWQKRRELLLEVCGDVSDTEVIASKKELSKLADILGNRTIEQHRKVIQARRSEINKELEKIPVRIDEVKRGLPNIDDITDPDALPDDIEKLRAELRKKQEELAQAKAGGQVAEKTKELRMIEAQIMDLKNKHRQALDEKVGEKRAELLKTQDKIHLLKSSIDRYKLSIQFDTSEIKTLDEKMETLRRGWHIENNMVFEFEQSETCPTCGQPLPAEQIEAAREKALADFNRTKAEKLESINAEGKRLAGVKQTMEQNLAVASEALAKAKADLAELEQTEASLKAEIEAIMQDKQPVESTPEYVRLQKQHEELQEQIRQAQADVSTTVAAIQKEVDELADAIKALELAQARFDARESGLKRIEELKAQERELAAEYERLEQELYLTEQFIRSKVQLLEEKINSRFQHARFKLFNVLINGGVEECCETLYQGVPYNSALNNAARINVGLDIINTLSEHYGFEAPIWIDNREAVTRLIPVRAQVISLIVSEQDKTLRVETAEKKVKEAV